MHRLSYKTLLIIVVFLLIPIVILLRINQRASTVSAAWWNDSWMYRSRVDTNNSGVGQTNVYITLTIGTSDTSRFQSDCGDIRFTNQSSNLLPYYIVSGCGTSSTVIHINFSTLPVGAQTFYLYYGNPSVANGFNSADFSAAASSTTATPAAEETGGGPISWWKFDEGTGTTAYDSTTNRFNGSFATGSSAPVWTAGDQCISGSCLYFGGSNYLTVANNQSLRFNGSNFTVSLWVKPLSTGSQAFIGKGQGTIRAGYQIYSAGGKFVFIYSDSATVGDQNVNGPTYSANTWYYLTMTVNKQTNTLQAYVNGLSVGTTDITGISDDASSTYDLIIGKNGSYFANAYIDNVKIYPYARTQSQIKLEYTTDLSGQAAVKGAAVGFGANSLNNSTLTNGLVGYWKFDEGTGTSSADSSGNGLTMTLTGTTLPQWSGGKYGIGLSYNGINSFTNLNDSTQVDFTNAFTASTWFYATTYGGMIMNKWSGGAAGQKVWFIGMLNFTNQLYITLSADGSSQTYYADGGPSITYNTWHHLVFVYDGTNKIANVYLDGSIYSFGLKSGTVPGTLFNGTAPFTLGNILDGLYFNGIIDETRLYNRALSASEVSALYNYAPGPVAYWKFDEGTGTTAYDSSGNNNNLRWFGTLGSQYQSGKYGKAASFDGTDNYIGTTAVGPITNINSAITVSAWVKIGNPAPTGGAGIVSKDDSVNRLFNLNYEGASNYFRWRIWQSDGTMINIPGPANAVTNQWYYLTGACGNLVCHLYINGIDVGTTAVYNGTIRTSAIPDLTLGSYTGTYWFKGQVDDVKIYNYARSQKQIIQDMNAGNPLSTSNSPLIWYKFDEGQGTVANNSGTLGSSINASFIGGTPPAWSNTGKYNKALLFDGNSTTISAANNSSLNIGTGSYSVFAWEKLSPSSGAHDIIVDKGGANIGDTGFWWGMDTNGLPDFNLNIGGTWLIQSGHASTRIDDNSWHRVGFTFDPTFGVKFWLDGKLDNSIGATTTINIQGNSPLYIGGYANFSGFTANGLIDEVKIYNYALASSDILLDYNRGGSAAFGTSNQTIGATTTSLDYCLPGDTTYCATPVGEWKFDEAVGTTAYDTSGNGNFATFSTGASAPVWSYGKTGRAVSYNGGYLTAADSSSLQLTSTGTIEAWIKPNAYAVNWSVILNKGNFGSGLNNYSLYFENSSSSLALNVGGTTTYGTDKISKTLIPLNTWSHVTGVWDGTKIYLYVNSILAGTAPMNGIPNTAGSNLYFGSSTGSYPYNGSLDQVKIYNYARTPAQIAWDYNRGGPIGWWKLDECQGSTIYDSSGLGNTGAISIGPSGTQVSIGTCSIGDTSAWSNGKTGKINSSLNFDANDDYVNLGNPGSLRLDNTNFTIAAWIKPTSTTATRTIFYEWGGSNGASAGQSIFFTAGNNGNGALTLDFYGGGCSGPAIDSGVWNFVVASYNSATKLTTYYKNGQSSSCTATIGPSFSAFNGSQIGARYAQGSGSFVPDFKGQIDDVRIYNYALTPTQIGQLYNGGAVNFSQ